MSYTIADEMPITTVGSDVIVCFITLCANIVGVTTSQGMRRTIADEMIVATRSCIMSVCYIAIRTGVVDTANSRMIQCRVICSAGVMTTSSLGMFTGLTGEVSTSKCRMFTGFAGIVFAV